MIKLPESPSLDIQISNQIYEVINSRIDAIKKKIVDEAAEKFKVEVSAAVGEAVIRLAEVYSVEMFGNKLRIEVSIGRTGQ